MPVVRAFSGEIGVGSVSIIRISPLEGPHFWRSAIGAHQADGRTPTGGRRGKKAVSGQHSAVSYLDAELGWD